MFCLALYYADNFFITSGQLYKRSLSRYDCMAKSSLCEVFGFGRRKAPQNSYANATNVNIFCKTCLKLGIDPSNYFFSIILHICYNFRRKPSAFAL